ncbi:hypothetical protein LEP1GSC121_3259 [Leptospira borgpetersenii serovar Castellonis str. 200801910]|uniref:Uncharacterized protein n=1 Tax=Leptospira borgpetersenii serovar Ballum TaxID=280505 RepID=A0A0S2IPX1_LEPBO|nr:hypothetical protein LBBP_01020 [Leptospira borgpetersenii serovar Ballum]EKQ98467.1 hypothetical protein LEP1GSC121_3259 [Leptospira borgpetersenii serovar Castellonis str. 200801910]
MGKLLSIFRRHVSTRFHRSFTIKRGVRFNEKLKIQRWKSAA